MAVESQENFSGGGERCRIAMISPVGVLFEFDNPSWQKNKLTLAYDTFPRGFAPSIHGIYIASRSLSLAATVDSLH